MKTNKQWLSELPDGYRELALANPAFIEGRESRSIRTAVCTEFDWELSNEGWDFWNAVRFHYESGTPLPPLPESRIPNPERCVDLRSSDSVEEDEEYELLLAGRRIDKARIAELEQLLREADERDARNIGYLHDSNEAAALHQLESNKRLTRIHELLKQNEEQQSRISILESALDAAITEAEYIRRHAERGITFSSTLLDDIKKLRA